MSEAVKEKPSNQEIYDLLGKLRSMLTEREWVVLRYVAVHKANGERV